jgi:signal transduction histidine kinase/DNA-binding response OmpR family regulator
VTRALPFDQRNPPAMSFLAGGGELGALMRAVDWARTAVGPVHTWPQSLRSAISMVLESRFPMCIAWGPELVQFYNDGFRPILGSTKHPGALGAGMRETYKETWDLIGPMLDGVLHGDAVGLDDFLVPLDRHGFLEDCYFVFSYSPLRSEGGRIGGILVTVSETTDRVLGQRRLEMLRALSVATAEARTDAAACTAAAGVLDGYRGDLPFALLYLFSDDEARLAASAGICAGSEFAPLRLDLDAPGPWPFAEVARTHAAVLIDDPPPLDLPTEPPSRGASGAPAIALPLHQPGVERPLGVLVAGISRRLVLDDRYRGFLDLTAGQIATALARTRALAGAEARAEALAELDRVKTAFFSNVSHEFRTPLTLLLGPTEEALARPHDLSADDLSRWRLVHRNALRLLKLVNTLLDFSRLEAGRVDAAYQATDLAAMTADLASQFRSAIDRAGLRLEVDCLALGVEVFVDRDMWEKIVLNLLSNALKFTFEGRISVRVSRLGDAVLLTVADTGVGIPSSELPHVFDRFHRVQGTRARTHEGTGIGLALVKELVQLHGGAVTVESEVHRGTTFTVSLPLGSAHLPAARVGAPRATAANAVGAAPFVEEALRWLPDGPTGPGRESAPPLHDPVTSVGRARVLLADDNADMRAYVGRILRDRWSVVAVPDGAAALEAARAAPPDLLIADVMMPGLDGFALLRELRADPRLRGVPVVFLSARAGDDARIEALQAGVDEYVVKPFSARELIARVSTLLEAARLRSEAEHARVRLHALLMQSPVPVSVVSGPDLVFDLANPRYEQMVGRSGLAGRRFRDVFPELADDAPVLGMLRGVRESGQPFAADEYLVRLDRDGDGMLEDVYFKLTCQPVRDGDALIGIMTVALDVTDQVRARRQVEAAQRQLAEHARIHETLNRIGRVLNAELDLDHILETLTEEATKLCRAQFGAFFHNVDDEAGGQYMLYKLAGVPREAFAGFPMPRNTPVFAPTFAGERAVRSDDITAEVNYGRNPPRHGMPEGHLPVRSYLAVPVVNRNGAVLGGLFFGHAEVGQFTAADEQLMVAVAAQAATAIDNGRLYQQARAAEARTVRLQAITANLSRAVTPNEAGETLLESAMPAIGAVAGLARLVSSDGRMLELFSLVGALPPDLVGRLANVPIDSAMPGSESARTGKVVWLPNAGAIAARNPELEDLRRRMGAEAWGAVPLAFEGRIIGVVSFWCGTEHHLSRADEEFLLAAGGQCAQAIVRAQLYADAQAARADAESANRAKDEFLAMLGHELRNPLAPIQTALQLMRLRGDQSLSNERRVIERQVEHVVRLVDDLLDVSRITRGKVELKRVEVELADVIAKAIEIAGPLVEEHAHILSVDVPRTGLRVSADPVRMAQVFANLLTNAAKYTGERGAIAIRATRDGAEVVARVTDSGVGIDPEMLPRVFEVFVQERQSLDRAQGGLGLGLTIVRNLVALHGGSVSAHSEGRGRGSEFVVRLPAIGGAAVAAAAPALEAAADALVADGLRILVVDDNVDAADLLAETLRATGHAAAVAYDGRSALAVAGTFAPDVALLDIGLPVMDGYELGGKLREANPAIRVVALTGYGQDSDRRRSQAAGFDGHLVKPVELDHLISLFDGFRAR